LIDRGAFPNSTPNEASGAGDLRGKEKMPKVIKPLSFVTWLFS